MKNIVLFISCLFLLAQCIDESKIRIPTIPDGVNLRVVIDPAHTGIFTDKITADYLAFDMFSVNKDLAEVDLFVSKAGVKKLVKTFSQGDFDAGNGKIHSN